LKVQTRYSCPDKVLFKKGYGTTFLTMPRVRRDHSFLGIHSPVSSRFAAI